MALDPTDLANALALLPAPLPAFDSAITSLTWECKQHRDELRWGPPTMPGHEVWAYDDGDDEPHYVRDCTPEEIAEREAWYEKSMAEWKRTGGIVFTDGPKTWHVTVSTETGSTYELVGDEKGWVVVREERKR